MLCPATSAVAVPPPPGDSYRAEDDRVGGNDMGLMFLRTRGDRLCFAQPLGHGFVDRKIKPHTYKGSVSGPQRSTRQRVHIAFAPRASGLFVTLTSRGRQVVPDSCYLRVTRREIIRSTLSASNPRSHGRRNRGARCWTMCAPTPRSPRRNPRRNGYGANTWSAAARSARCYMRCYMKRRNRARKPGFVGGSAPPGTRTPNPLVKSQLLCQLS